MAPPTNQELMELIFAVKLLAKTIDEVDEKAAILLAKVDAITAADASRRELISNVDKKLEILPLVIAGKLEGLVEKKTSQAFEDIRITLDELRNKLYAVSKNVKSVKEQTGSHQLPSMQQFAKWEKDKEDDDKEGGVVIKRGKFRLELPFSEGTWRVIKIVLYVVVAVAATVATGGGIWAFVDRVKHSLSGG